MKTGTVYIISILFLAGVSVQAAGDDEMIQGSYVSKFKRFEVGEAYQGSPSYDWRDIAWRGDRIHNQIMLWTQKDVENLSLEISDLAGEDDIITINNIRIHTIKYIKGDPEARNCDGYPERTASRFVYLGDALSKDVQDFIFRKDPLKLWVTIDIPPSVKSGEYTGTIAARLTGSAPINFNIQLNVVEHILPPPRQWGFHLDIWQFPVSVLDRHNDSAGNAAAIKPWSEEHLAMLIPAYRLLADMGQKAITTYIKEGAMGAPSMVKWTLAKDGVSWTFDFSLFDRYVETLMALGIDQQINAFSPVGWNTDQILFWDEGRQEQMFINAKPGSQPYNALWNHFLTQFKIHLQEKDWFDKTVLYLDEVPEQELKSVIALVNYNSPDWKLGLAGGHKTRKELLAGFYDIASIFGLARNEKKTKDQIRTFYTSCEQTFPNNYLTRENSPAELTWIAWYAANEQFDGYLRWAFDHWTLDDPFDIRDGLFTSGDFSFIYRDSNAAPIDAVNSIRAEMLREGIQDFEKLGILKRQAERCDDYSFLAELHEQVSRFTIDSAVQGQFDPLIEAAQDWLDNASLVRPVNFNCT